MEVGDIREFKTDQGVMTLRVDLARGGVVRAYDIELGMVVFLESRPDGWLVLERLAEQLAGE